MRGFGYTYVDKNDCLEMTFAQLSIVCSSQVEKQDVKLIAWFAGFIDKERKKGFSKKENKLWASKKDVYYSTHAAIHYNPLP